MFVKENESLVFGGAIVESVKMTFFSDEFFT